SRAGSSRWRARTTTATGCAPRERASRRARWPRRWRGTRPGSRRRRLHVGDVLGVEPPALAARPRLPLPDGDRALQGVDAEAGRRERLLPVGGGDDHDDGALADGEDARAVQQRDPADVGPAGPGLLGDGGQPGHDLGLVGRGLGARAARAAGGGVAGRAGDRGDGAAGGAQRPGHRLGHGQGRRRQAEPRVARGRRQLRCGVHRRSCYAGGRRRDGTGGAVRHGALTVTLRRVPCDDDAGADIPGHRPPPHPDDRLWRHPSEVGAAAAAPAGAAATAGAGPARGGRRWPAYLAAAAAGAVLAGGALAAVGLGERVVERPVTERVAVPEAPAGGADAPDGADDVAPAVVAVVSGGRPVGSGLVVRDDGVVVTSASLVGGRAEVTVQLEDGSAVAGEVVGTDPVTGLAVVDLSGAGHPAGLLGTTADLAPGTGVLVFGAAA